MTHPLVRQARKRWLEFFRPRTLPLRQWQAGRKQQRLVGATICVTGSCGKTTTSMLTGQLLSLYGTVAANVDNNAVSWVLRQVRKLRRPVQFQVHEVSGGHPGALKPILDALRVDTAVVTTIGTDHRAAFRDAGMDIEDAIAAEKGTLVEAVGKDGVACLNADDPRVAAMAARAACRVVTYGTVPGATLRAVDIDARWPRRLSFRLLVEDQDFRVQTQLVGSLMLPSILAALSVVHAHGFDLARAVDAVGKFSPLEAHSSVETRPGGRTFVNDTFKASFWSTRRLIADLDCLGTKDLIFVLGEVSDIHGATGQRYRQLLREASDRARLVIATGRAASYGERVQRSGISNIVPAMNNEDVVAILLRQPPGLVYLKATVSNQLGAVIELMDRQTSLAGQADGTAH